MLRRRLRLPALNQGANAARGATLDGLRAGIASCERCPLSSTRRAAALPRGRAETTTARILLITAPPGYPEERDRVAISGAAADLLDRALDEAAIRPESVVVASIVACRPPGDRDPSEAELAACRDHLDRIVAVTGATAVVTLGEAAARGLFGAEFDLERGRGHRRSVRLGTRDVPAVATFSPAAARFAPALFPILRDDLRVAAALTSPPGPPALPETDPPVPGRPAPPPVALTEAALAEPSGDAQLGLF